MEWKGQQIVTLGDLMERGIDQCATPEEAREFMRLYRDENVYAATNVGYVAGYYSSLERKRIQEWFGVAHPIFGTGEVSGEEAFDLGKRLGEQARKEGRRR